MKIDCSDLFKRKDSFKIPNHFRFGLMKSDLENFNRLKFFNFLILFNISLITLSVNAQIDEVSKTKINITTESYLSKEINTTVNRPTTEINSVNYVPIPPVIGIVQNGTTNQCNPSTVQLCNRTGTLYALSAYPLTSNCLAKYTANTNSNSLVKDNTFAGINVFSVNYGIDRNPLTGIVYIITGQGVGSERRLYTINLATNAISNKGPVISTTGSNQVQDFTFDNSGNMYASFQGGVIQKINYNSAALTPTAFASGLPTGGVGLTYDFDANRLIYATGTFASKKVYQISTSGVWSLMFNYSSSIAATSQGIEYVGNNICYVTSTDSSDIIFKLDLSTQTTSTVLSPVNFSAEIKDLMFIPLSLQWSGPNGNIGATNCINVSPTTTTTYSLVGTNEFGLSTSATHIVTVNTVPCSNSIVNLKLFIEGYYESNGLMRSVKNNQDGSSPLNEVESITVELHNATSPYETVATTTALLRTNGVAICLFPSTVSGSYYIAVKSSNIIQTWSATPELVGAVPLNYDFSTEANKAYGDNMKNLDVGVFGFYSGDINNDDVIDGSDATFLDIDIFNSEFGVRNTDLNGDGSVDGSDSVIFDNNSYNSVFSFFPG